MCLGFAVLDAAYIWAAGLLGYPDALRQYPEVAALVVAANMSIPMAAWMRYRGMSWRPIGEMSAAMFVEAVVLIGAYWLGLIAGRDVFLWEHGLMMPFMIAPMLFRLELYTGMLPTARTQSTITSLTTSGEQPELPAYPAR
jgi:hypothetical protein